MLSYPGVVCDHSCVLLLVPASKVDRMSVPVTLLSVCCAYIVKVTEPMQQGRCAGKLQCHAVLRVYRLCLQLHTLVVCRFYWCCLQFTCHIMACSGATLSPFTLLMSKECLGMLADAGHWFSGVSDPVQ